MGSEGWRQVKEEAEKQIANSWGSRIENSRMERRKQHGTEDELDRYKQT